MQTVSRSSLFRLPAAVGGIFACACSIAACSVEDPGPEFGAGGTSAGSSGVAGSVSSAGASAGTSSSGMAGSGVTTGGQNNPQGGTSSMSGAAGSAHAGSANGGSSSGGTAGGGGSSAGGSSGGSAGGGSGGSAPVQASAGCGKASPMTGSGNSPLMVSGHQYYVKLPSAYDASKPYRVIFVFNPTNNPITWAEQSAGFEQNAAKDNAIRVYPHPANSSSGWGAGDVSFFRPLYDQIVANFCVDKARVFATGESSGGDFSSILGCEHANVLRGVAPCATKAVGQYPLTPASRKCTGEVASIVIHGKNDNVVGPENGPKTRDFYAALNHCNSMTMPVQGYTDSQSNCVQFQGCDAGFPVYWCQHTDPNYSNTNHGWPKFAPAMIWSTFSAY